jgi:hypothetical protein
LLRELEELYIPEDDRQLRRVQRRGEELDRAVRGWGHAVVEILPRGLPVNPDEVYLLSLFLAQQHRLNLQMDGCRPDEGLLANLKRTLPFVLPDEDPEEFRAIHRVVASRLDSDIDRASDFFCTEHNVPAESEPAIDWRVSIRFMAQSVYTRVAGIEPKKMPVSPRRFELALVARDLASEIVDRRHGMFSAFAGPVPRPSPAPHAA